MLIIVLKQSNRFDMKVNASLLMKKILSASYYFYQFWLEFYTEAPKGYKTPKDTLVLKIYTLVFFFFLVLKVLFISELPVNLFVIVGWVWLTGAMIQIGNWDTDIFLSFTFFGGEIFASMRMTDIWIFRE